MNVTSRVYRVFFLCFVCGLCVISMLRNGGLTRDLIHQYNQAMGSNSYSYWYVELGDDHLQDQIFVEVTKLGKMTCPTRLLLDQDLDDIFEQEVIITPKALFMELLSDSDKDGFHDKRTGSLKPQEQTSGNDQLLKVCFEDVSVAIESPKRFSCKNTRTCPVVGIWPTSIAYDESVVWKTPQRVRAISSGAWSSRLKFELEFSLAREKVSEFRTLRIVRDATDVTLYDSRLIPTPTIGDTGLHK